MNTKIKFTYKDVPYVLEYNRMAIKQMEASGFTVEEFTKKPMLNIDLAFKGLFLKNHRRTNDDTIEEIFKNFKNKDGLITQIGKMLDEAYATLLDDDEEGNIEWDIESLNEKK